MAKDDRGYLECKDCKVHSRIEGEVEDLKKLKPVSSAAAWAFFVVFLSVCLGVVGFLWHGQVAIWENVNLNHKETMSKMDSLKSTISLVNNKLDVLDMKAQGIEKKVDEHINESHKKK